ncbi:MAG: FHA domain-containing protein [Anaerolineae bacterium]|nr:FHA domain-containing protein [Anaerolineae bacterium]
MATVYQSRLEIIAPGGQIEFYDLDPGRGITNIGRHPENDVVIDSPTVAPFHAVLDHRKKPYHLMVLAAGQVSAETRLQGQPLTPNIAQELHDWDTFEIDGYSLILVASSTEAAVHKEPFPGEQPEQPPLAVPPPTTGAPAPVPDQAEQLRVPSRESHPRPTALAALPPDSADELIVTELSAREWTVDVEQTATTQVTIVNGGQIVATFAVRVDGLDESWVSISQPQVNLFEGARATVTISITPPRLPTSRAGAHPLAVVVTSPNYPGHVSQMGATLNINPYYEFAVGELSPRQQTIRWRKRSGQVTLSIVNKGNSEAVFRLEGADDERRCHFEFDLPGEEVSLAKQAEVRLPPGESVIPIGVTPMRRRLIALRLRTYPFTITTSMTEGAQAPRSVMGQLKTRPLIGLGTILLTLLVSAILIVFFFKPTSEPGLAVQSRESLRPGATVILAYNASRFQSLSSTNILNRLNGLSLDVALEYRTENPGEWQTLKAASELTGLDGTLALTTTQNTKYRLRATSWISKIAPMFTGLSREIPVYVTPVEPQITSFNVDRPTVVAGQTVTLFWQVFDAEALRLQYGDMEEPLLGSELERGTRRVTVERDTTFTLIATNSFWPKEVKRTVFVKVLQATSTPVPTPVILRFDVDPLAILVGETVRINWEVSGADLVNIEPIGNGLPLKGDVGDQPLASILYRLTAIKVAEDGSEAKNGAYKEVVVSPQPTATPVPVAPQIQLFEATPKEVIAGEGEVVRLTWSVTGDTTNIEITSPNVQLSGLEAQDSITVTVEETTLFVLTASNGDLKTSRATEVKALEPTPTPTPTPIPTEPPPTPTPTPTLTPYPTPVIVYFLAEALSPPDDKVVFRERQDGPDGPVFVYDVEAGSNVKLSWQVNGADRVTLVGYEDLPATGAKVVLVTIDSTFQLTAENPGGRVNAFVVLEVYLPQPPPPPYAVTGTEGPDGNEIRWAYSAAFEDIINGFRIYRADLTVGGGFQPVQDVAPGVHSWLDPISPTCDQAYYVVAVYSDPITGEERETDASATSWYSQPCP